MEIKVVLEIQEEGGYTVPVHYSLKKGTLHQIIKASGLKEEDFL